MDKELTEARDTAKRERIEKEREAQFNKELKKVIKQLRQKLKGESEIKNQYQTYHHKPEAS